jgi:hypothetical protein
MRSKSGILPATRIALAGMLEFQKVEVGNGMVA